MGPRETMEPETTDLRYRLAPEPSRPRPKGRWLAWVIILAALGAAVWYFHGVAATEKAKSAGAARSHARATNQAVPVVVAAARQESLPVYLTGLGTVAAFNTVTIHTRVDGQIMSVAFREGQFVHQGDPLVEIDPRPYQVMLEQAQAQLSKDSAALHDATVNYGRDQALIAGGVIPKQQLDTQTATMLQDQAAVKGDQAQIDNAKLDLAYCHVTAPIAGRIGLRLVDPGNIVHAGDTNGLLVITQLQPIAVIFTLPEDQLPAVYKKLRAGQSLPVDAYDRNDTTKIASGKLLAIDNQIDTATGTYKLKAVFNNEDNALFPNQFVNMHLLVDVRKGLTVVPAAAVQRGPGGSTYVYVVNSSNIAQIHQVNLALASGTDVGLSSGLQPGDSVVIDGLDKLQNGSLIEARNPTGGPARVGDPAAGEPRDAAGEDTATRKPSAKPGRRGQTK